MYARCVPAFVATALAFAACGGGAPAARVRERVRISGTPDRDPTALTVRYQPLVDHLSVALDARVLYVPVTDYKAAVGALEAGKLQFAWLSAASFVDAKRRLGAVPLLSRQIDRESTSVLIARRDAAGGDPKDLRGKRFLFGPRGSVAGHLIPREMLASRFGLDTARDFATPVGHAASDEALVSALVTGQADAGALGMAAWQRLLAEGKADERVVHVLWQSSAQVDHVWAAHPAVPPEQRERFRRALLRLSLDNDDDRRVLGAQGARAYVAASASDFDLMEHAGVAAGLWPARPSRRHAERDALSGASLLPIGEGG